MGEKGRDNSLGKRKGVLTVPLSSKTEGLDTLQEKEGTKGVQASTNITEEFCSDFGRECSSTESLAELETMIAFSWLSESREFSGPCPVEFT